MFAKHLPGLNPFVHRGFRAVEGGGEVFFVHAPLLGNGDGTCCPSMWDLMVVDVGLDDRRCGTLLASRRNFVGGEA